MSEVPNPAQGELVDDYQQFMKCVDSWQVLFDNLDVEDPEFDSYKAAAIAEIDPLCPHKDRWVSMTGRGEIPELAKDSQTGAVVIAGKKYYGQTIDGMHNGVVVRMHQGPDDIAPHPKIMHMVIFGEANGSVQDGLEFRSSKFLAYFNIEPATTVIDILEIESMLRLAPEVNSDDLDFNESLALLTDYSNYIDELYRSSYFRKLDPKAQQEMLQSVVDEAEAEVRLRDVPFNMKVKYGLVSLTSEDKIHLLPISLEEYALKGTIIGIESVENICLSSDKTTLQTDQTEDDYSGLCLVVALNPEVRDELQLTDKQVLYLPISSEGFEDY